MALRRLKGGHLERCCRYVAPADKRRKRRRREGGQIRGDGLETREEMKKDDVAEAFRNEQ